MVEKKLENGCQNAPKKSIRRITVSSGATGSRHSKVVAIGISISEAIAAYAHHQSRKSAMYSAPAPARIRPMR